MKIWNQLEVFWGILLVSTCLAVASASIPLTLVTDPEGPNYPAASWVRFACRASADSASTLRYQWIGKCNDTDRTELMIGDPFLDEEGYAVIWIQATPISCMDYLECTVADMIGGTGAAGRLVVNASGVGLGVPSVSMEDVANNSAIIVTHGAESPGLLCQSALRRGSSSAVASWRGPDGNEVTREEDVGTSEYVYSVLPLDELTEEGIYTCLVPDEYGQEWPLLVAVYTTAYPRRNSLRISMSYRIAPSSVVLVCETTGLPATATLWSKDGLLLSLNETYSKDIYITGQMLADAHTSSYVNTLEFVVDGSELDGVYGCDVYSDWVAANFTQSGRESVKGQFAFYTVGSAVTLNCALPEEFHLVEWLYKDDVLVHNGSNMIGLQLAAYDVFHDEYFVCRGTSSSGVITLPTKMIVYVPEDAISLTIKGKEDAALAVGQPFSITCCVLTHLEGISSSPQLVWVGPGGEVLSANSSSFNHDTMSFNVSENGAVLCGSLNIESAKEPHQGSYSCMATLKSPALAEPLVKIEHFRIRVEGGDAEEEPQSMPVALVAAVSSAVVVLLAAGTILITVILIALRKRMKKAETKAATNGAIATTCASQPSDR